VARVLPLLPTQPERVVVIDLERSSPALRQAHEHAEGFVINGKRTVYLTKQSAIMQKALAGAGIWDYALAITVWHEMAHLDGSDEPHAQEKEEGLWRQFVVAGLVDSRRGMAYLALLRKRRQTRLNSDLDPALRFHCNEGFSVSKCEEELARLRNVLADFDLRTLGEWTWILVRSEDWKPILRQVGRDPDSPAFTILAARQTFLEEALFDPDPLRSRTLLERFRMPLDKLLPFAVAHELAHALCREADERRTDRYATQLRQTGMTSCREHSPASRAPSVAVDPKGTVTIPGSR